MSLADELFASLNYKARFHPRSDLRTPADHVHGAKLCEEDIPVIRGLIAQGLPFGEIARRYGVDKSTIGCVHRRATWRHVP